MDTKSDEPSGFLWAEEPDNPNSITRNLTNTERMFFVLNRDMYGQNCPFIGASISVQNTENSSSQSDGLKLEVFEKRAIEAFCQTRWRYPTVAARVTGDSKAVYLVENGNRVIQWAKRCVVVVVAHGGWSAKREQVSKDSPIPSPNGDYTTVYLIVKPGDILGGSITTFDILMHMHHVFIDGSGVRTILNEFISRLANPLPSDHIHWGKEIDRLLPPSNIIAQPEQITPDTTGIDSTPKVSGKLFAAQGVGLPLCRPDIGPPAPQYRGTKLVSHTFEPEFLRKLLSIGREHGVKLTAMLHAALLQAVHKTINIKHRSEDFYQSRSAMDLRNGWLQSPYNEKRYYVSGAFVIHPIEVPCTLFEQEDGFWVAATYISNIWEVAKKQKGMVATLESESGAFLESRSKLNSITPPGKPRTCPYFVSDPPGSQLLDSNFPVSGYENLHFVLESYQLATDQSQAAVSARSHSFHDKLTLCLVFNAARNPEEKMQEFLVMWMRIVEDVCETEMGLV